MPAECTLDILFTALWQRSEVSEHVERDARLTAEGPDNGGEMYDLSSLKASILSVSYL